MSKTNAIRVKSTTCHGATPILLAAAILLPFFHILFYVWSTARNIVFRDDMYLIKGSVVEKFCDGTLAFADLWRAAAGTRLLGYNLLLLANTAWFGLNSRAVVLLIPFVLLAAGILIYRDYHRSLAGLRSPAWIAGLYALPMLLLFNLTLWEGLGFAFAIIFVWSVPWYLVSYYALEDLLRTGRRISWLCAIIATSLAFLVFGQTSSFAFAVALAITLGCGLWINRQNLPKGIVFRVAAVVALFALLVFLYLYRIRTNDYFPGSTRLDLSLLNDPRDLVSFILTAMLASVLGVDVSKAHFSPSAIVAMGSMVILVYSLALFLYFKTRMYERTYLPLYLITYTFAFVGFMTVGRFRFGLQYGMASRYTCNTIYGIIAIVWIAIFVRAKSAPVMRFVQSALLASATLFFAGLLWTTVVEWRVQPYRKLRFERLQAIALELDTAFDDELAGFEERPSVARDSLLVLRKYRLNVYRAGMPSSRVQQTRPPRPPSRVRLAVPAGGANSTATSSRPGAGRSGYATVESDAGGIPYAAAILRFTQNDRMVSETALPTAPPTTRVRAFVESGARASPSPWGLFPLTAHVDTGIAFVNRGADQARITYTLRNSQGTILASGSGVLPPGSRQAKLIGELGDRAPDFKFPDDFAASVQYGSLEIASDQPISAAALRLVSNERNDSLVTTTPLADLNREPSKAPIYLPLFADGDGYASSLILLNTSNVRETGAFRVLDRNGMGVPVRQADGNPDSTFRFSMEPGGLYRFRTDGTTAIKRECWVQVIPDANVPAPVAMGMLHYRQNGVLVTESGVPAADPTTHARIYVDGSAARDTALAISNPAGSAAGITLEAYGLDGNKRPDGSHGLVRLTGQGQVTGSAGELIEGLPRGFTGVVDVTSTTPIVVTALRSLVTLRRDVILSVFPAADLTRESTSPMVFPHVLDGDGYATEFVLLGAGTPGTAVIKFFGENGLPLTVGK